MPDKVQKKKHAFRVEFRGNLAARCRRVCRAAKETARDLEWLLKNGNPVSAAAPSHPKIEVHSSDLRRMAGRLRRALGQLRRRPSDSVWIYRRHTISRTPVSGMYVTLSHDAGMYLKADTLAGIKQLITKAVKGNS